MGINKVQFQRGLPMAEFMERYATQEPCHAALVASRWPQRFVCSDCGATRHSRFEREGRQYGQCSTWPRADERDVRHDLPSHQVASDALVSGNAPAWANKSLCASAQLVSDGLWCFKAVAACGATHQRTVTGGGAASVKLEKFLAVNTLLGNLKTAFAGTYHSFDFAK